MQTTREAIAFDVLFVGGGPAGLAGAIHLMQLARAKGLSPEVALIDKGAEIGAHAVSGAVLNPRALEELLPDFEARGFPGEATVRGDEFYLLTADKAWRMPWVPRQMHNQGYRIVSLARVTRWLAAVAEALGVNVFPGFDGREVLYDESGRKVIGVRTGDKGLGPDGRPKGNFEPGIDLLAKATVLCEGARGSLARQIEKRVGHLSGNLPQVYEVGLKEVVQLPRDNYFSSSRGNDLHFYGYPLGLDLPGGGFLYEMAGGRAALGLLVGLNYPDPTMDPYGMFLAFKRHPFVAELLSGGAVVEQGARTVSTGGYYTLTDPALDGALLIGACAGIQNPPGLKGIHLCMKSGMLAAETLVEALQRDDFSKAALGDLARRYADSWMQAELLDGRNFTAALRQKGVFKFVHLGAQYVSGGRGLRDRLPLAEDAASLVPGKRTGTGTRTVGAYDDTLYLDKLAGVFRSKTLHREDQPSHIVIHDPALCVGDCYRTYGCPCTHFCPGKVYELDDGDGVRRLRLTASNCLHCKTCDIKDPYGNITWTCPEGGQGPGYTVV